ncbi:MAG: hypothetical protein IJZ57_10035 [Clostridia bacterium]|nr:hypothetical protein [Clostridia bacterium]
MLFVNHTDGMVKVEIGEDKFIIPKGKKYEYKQEISVFGARVTPVRKTKTRCFFYDGFNGRFFGYEIVCSLDFSVSDAKDKSEIIFKDNSEYLSLDNTWVKSVKLNCKSCCSRPQKYTATGRKNAKTGFVVKNVIEFLIIFALLAFAGLMIFDKAVVTSIVAAVLSSIWTIYEFKMFFKIDKEIDETLPVDELLKGSPDIQRKYFEMRRKKKNKK